MTIAERLKQEGHEEGKQIAQKEIAQAMLRKGVEPEFIMEVTSLTKQELEKLRR